MGPTIGLRVSPWVIGEPVFLGEGESTAEKERLIRHLDAAGLRWQPDPSVPPVWFRVFRDAPDDDGPSATAGSTPAA